MIILLSVCLYVGHPEKNHDRIRIREAEGGYMDHFRLKLEIVTSRIPFLSASVVAKVGLDAPLSFRWIFCVRVHITSLAFVTASLRRGE